MAHGTQLVVLGFQHRRQGSGIMTMENLLAIDWIQAGSHCVRLLVAYGLAFPIGLNRVLSDQRFGLRTYPLVSVVSCGFMLVGISTIGSTDGEARVLQGILTGIGFIGGGAIFKGEDNVVGMISAASIWNTGAIGVAVAFNRLEIAIVLSLINIATLLMVGQVKEKIQEEVDNGAAEPERD
jgi:putative Mg2+ transporter-C (MgtC) family protein